MNLSSYTKNTNDAESLINSRGDFYPEQAAQTERNTPAKKDDKGGLNLITNQGFSHLIQKGPTGGLSHTTSHKVLMSCISENDMMVDN